MKVWISKYALTQSIFEKEVEDCENLRGEFKGMVSYKEKGYSVNFHGEGNEWHRTKEEAIKKTEEMKLKKIISHKKAIAKLEKMKFE